MIEITRDLEYVFCPHCGSKAEGLGWEICSGPSPSEVTCLFCGEVFDAWGEVGVVYCACAKATGQAGAP